MKNAIKILLDELESRLDDTRKNISELKNRTIDSKQKHTGKKIRFIPINLILGKMDKFLEEHKLPKLREENGKSKEP